MRQFNLLGFIPRKLGRCGSAVLRRYLTIARPASPHLSPTTLAAILASIWSTSLVLAVPTLLYSATIQYSDSERSVERFTEYLIQ